MTPMTTLTTVQPTLDIAAPGVEEVSQLVAILAFEVLAGRRPLRQLAMLVHRDVLSQLDMRMAITTRTAPGGASQAEEVRPLANLARVQHTSPTMAEVCINVRTAGRVHATALLLEREHGRWRVRALELG